MSSDVPVPCVVKLNMSVVLSCVVVSISCDVKLKVCVACVVRLGAVCVDSVLHVSSVFCCLCGAFLVLLKGIL